MLKRNRVIYGVLIIAVVLLGLGSRHFSLALPKFIGEYSGDTLWALMVYLIIGFMFNSLSIKKTAMLSVLFSYGIEISQVYHSAWIDSIRGTLLGGLILGYGFLWSDLACYIVGILIGVISEYIISKFSSLSDIM